LATSRRWRPARSRCSTIRRASRRWAGRRGGAPSSASPSRPSSPATARSTSALSPRSSSAREPLALSNPPLHRRRRLSGYAVAAGRGEATLRELGSRFLATAAPAGDAEAAKTFVAAAAERHAGATHVCFAWRIGWPPEERASDAGEPAGTAGAPLLRALRRAGLTDTVVVVVRWFGGTKLGKGGLARAYGGAARAALAELPVRRERPRRRLVVACDYARLGAVKRLLRPGEVDLVGERYGEEAELTLAVDPRGEAALVEALAALGLAPRAR
jgi:uncharacterized YigZ family protein